MKESLNRSWICLFEVLVQLARRLFLWARREKMAPPAVAAPTTTAMVCARQGRLRQRYEGCYRLVSGCIPYMLKEEDGESSCQDVLGRLQVLMISTPKRGDLIFPKGGWEDDESIDEAACREAFEEAGVKGIISVGNSAGRMDLQEQEQAEQLRPARGLQGLHVWTPGHGAAGDLA
ncbi:hypothetical protein PAHAL_8G196000 [Panicum hallii]|uniref:Nudix hydrolase domain-containing protein n=2 Tax=Panicum hallii TaxID=206008 RepID=A0A2T8I9L4_9POAL|nr:hypothetical protein PAHAL_8G196000 [Panicum hallii]